MGFGGAAVEGEGGGAGTYRSDALAVEAFGSGRKDPLDADAVCAVE